MLTVVCLSCLCATVQNTPLHRLLAKAEQASAKPKREGANLLIFFLRSRASRSRPPLAPCPSVTVLVVVVSYRGGGSSRPVLTPRRPRDDSRLALGPSGSG